MPRLLKKYGSIFHFYSHEPNEPPHVHVRQGRKEMKVWLETLGVAESKGYTTAERRRLMSVVAEHRDEFLEKWYAYFE